MMIDDIAERTKPQQKILKETKEFAEIIVETVRESLLVLDADLKVVSANGAFYRTFQVNSIETIDRYIYDLGNGQWDIPDLRKLLENILPKNTFFKGFQVAHEFPFIGRKIMILNARQIHFNSTSALFPPIILLVIEDVTEMMAIAETLAAHTSQLEEKFTKRTQKLEIHIEKLEKVINDLKEQVTSSGTTL